MFKFRVQNSPLTPVEQGHDARDDYQSSPSSSTASRDSQGSGRTGKLGSRRRRSRGTTSKNIEKRPYHSPTHVSPPHDKPMTKNDMYFALDCEVRTWLVCLNIVEFEECPSHITLLLISRPQRWWEWDPRASNRLLRE